MVFRPDTSPQSGFRDLRSLPGIMRALRAGVRLGNLGGLGEKGLRSARLRGAAFT